MALTKCNKGWEARLEQGYPISKYLVAMVSLLHFHYQYRGSKSVVAMYVRYIGSFVGLGSSPNVVLTTYVSNPNGSTP